MQAAHRENSTNTVSEELLNQVEFKIADQVDELVAAFQLLFRQYLRAGLTQEQDGPLRITPWHHLPTTEVLVAKLRDEVIATISLVRDGDLGLPMESIYSEEIAVRRAQGLQMAEASCLADRRADPKRGFEIVNQLMGLMAQAAVHRGVEYLTIAVHPRHARFYQRYIGFQVIGHEKNYQAVCDNPAVALELNVLRLSQEDSDIARRYFGQAFSEEALRCRSMTSEIQRLADRQRNPIQALLTSVWETNILAPPAVNPIV